MEMDSRETAEEIVDDFMARNLDALSKDRNDQQFHEMFQAAMETSFKKWCDDQWERNAGFFVIDSIAAP